MTVITVSTNNILQKGRFAVFFDNLKKPERAKTGFFGDFAQGVICAILAVVCFIFYKREWVFGLIFAACAAVRLWHHFKMKREGVPSRGAGEDEDEDYYDLYDEYDALTGDNDEKGKPLTRKERKARYKEYLHEIDSEFPDIDIDEKAEADDSNGKED